MGYVLVNYVVNGYVIGDEGSGGFTTVSAVGSSWLDAEGYVLLDYTVDDYVLGDEPTGSWSTVSSSPVTWV